MTSVCYSYNHIRNYYYFFFVRYNSAQIAHLNLSNSIALWWCLMPLLYHILVNNTHCIYTNYNTVKQCCTFTYIKQVCMHPCNAFSYYIRNVYNNNLHHCTNTMVMTENHFICHSFPISNIKCLILMYKWAWLHIQQQ